jgi:hypothetical protein
MTAFWDVAPCSLGDRPDDGGNKQFWNVGRFLPDNMATTQKSRLHTRRCENLKSYKFISWLGGIKYRQSSRHYLCIMPSFYTYIFHAKTHKILITIEMEAECQEGRRTPSNLYPEYEAHWSSRESVVSVRVTGSPDYIKKQWSDLRTNSHT